MAVTYTVQVHLHNNAATTSFRDGSKTAHFYHTTVTLASSQYGGTGTNGLHMSINLKPAAVDQCLRPSLQSTHISFPQRST